MSFKKNNKKKSELSTILTIGAFIFIGVSSIISAVLSPQRTTTKARASEILSGACKQRVDNKVYVFFKRNGAKPVCSVDQIKQGTPSDPIDSWLVDETKSCTTNSNCGDGAWCYFFENKASKARCMTRDLSCDNGVCLSASSGSSNNNSSSNSGINVQPAPLGSQSGSSSASYSANSCFSIGADFEVRNDGDRKAFYSWVTFKSQTPGNLSLYFNNAGVAGPNSFGGGDYTYHPVWTQPFTHSNEAPAVVLSKGQSNSIWYRGVHSGCSQAQVIDINCNLSYDNNGSTIVSGAGCSCRNCQIFSSPAMPTPRPPSNRSPGTSSRSSITQTPTLNPTPISRPSNLGKLYGPCRNTEPRCDEGLVCNREVSTDIFRCIKIIPSPTPTSIPTPTVFDLCMGLNNGTSCIDYSQPSNLNCIINDENKNVHVVSTGTRIEECGISINGKKIGRNNNKGSRNVKIISLGSNNKYSCGYSFITNQNQEIKCNYDQYIGKWNEQCIDYCEIENYIPEEILIKFNSSVFNNIRNLFTKDISYNPNSKIEYYITNTNFKVVDSNGVIFLYEDKEPVNIILNKNQNNELLNIKKIQIMKLEDLKNIFMKDIILEFRIGMRIISSIDNLSTEFQYIDFYFPRVSLTEDFVIIVNDLKQQ